MRHLNMMDPNQSGMYFTETILLAVVEPLQSALTSHIGATLYWQKYVDT